MAISIDAPFTDHSGCSTEPPTNGVYLSDGLKQPEAVEEEELEPIAIIGLSLRFPQDAVSEDSFWDMLLQRRCASTEFPKDRMNIDAFSSSNPNAMNKISTRSGHFLEEDIRAFDARFFSISPLEAATMDPQQRGLLETTYRALENAGIPAGDVKGSNTSVHVGSFTSDFETMYFRDAQHIPRYTATGTAKSILSNRISWFFDLVGPSMTIDTACSSSMVALDSSCKGLWSGVSDIGIVAGANLIFSPELNIALSNMNFLGRDGRCYSFDDRANGYARGEGFGVLVLKRVSRAIKDGDTIRALIRSTGVNQDGHTAGGVTQPNKLSQSQLISDTYHKAKLDMNVTRYFEAHGTGTAIGDPIEARAIGESFCRGKHSGDTMYIGAVKSNIGHLEGASGIAGLIKTIHVLERGIIPPNTNFENLNPQIDAQFFNFEFPRESRPWPSIGLRRASVNSFGFGGTNAHAVLDDAYHYLKNRNLRGNHCSVEKPPDAKGDSRHAYRSDGTNGVNGVNGVKESHEPPAAIAQNKHQTIPRLLVWSAADEKGLARIATAYSKYFSSHENLDPSFLDSLAYTLDSRRTSLPWKSFVVAGSTSVLKDLRTAISNPTQTPISKPKIGFIFTGQGAQWHAMGRDLVVYPVFLDSLTRSEDYLTQTGCKWSLRHELLKNSKESRVNEPVFSQSLCTAVQLALVDLTRALGIVPVAVVGHSSGEIAAAYSTGSLSHMSAIRLAYHRGVLASKLAATSKCSNRMVAVGLSEDATREKFQNIAQREPFDAHSMTVSCINSPRSVTVSGPELQVDIFIAHMEKENIFARKLMVNVGYHSPQMEEIAAEYLEQINLLEPGKEMRETLMVSSVLGKLVSSDVLSTPEYWVKNLISPVNFNEAMRKCCYRSSSARIPKRLDRSHIQDIAIDSWLEIGPHSALQGPFRDILSSMNKVNQVGYSSILIRNSSAIETFLAAMGCLHCQGFPVNIRGANLSNVKPSRPLQALKDLPEYPFDHSVIYWEESRINKEFRFRKHAHHSLLGSPMLDWNPLEPRWRLIVRPDEMPWLEDHRVNGSILYPAAGMLAMAVEAMKQLAGDSSAIGFEIRNATFHTAVVVPPGKEGIEMQICLREAADAGNRSAWHDFRLYVYKFDDEFEEVCRGSVRPDYGRFVSDVDNGKEGNEILSGDLQRYESASKSCISEVEDAKMYRVFKEMGLEYGPAFQSLHEIHFNNSGEATANVALSKWLSAHSRLLGPGQSQVIHPSTLDGTFQLSFVALSQGGLISMPTLVPSRIDKLWVSSSGIGKSTSGSVRAYSEAHKFSQRSARCSISALSESQEPLLRIEGFEVTAISSTHADEVTQESSKYLGYYIDWKADIDALDREEVLQYCERAYKPEVEPIEWYRNMDFLALAFGSAALVEVQRKDRNIAPSMAKYAAWIRVQLDRDVDGTPEPERLHREQLLLDPKYVQQISETMVSSSRGNLYVKIGNQLDKLLVGDLDPLPLLFDQPQLLSDFYQELNEDSQAFSLFSEYLGALVHKDPSMKIVEIGAGTGATTKILHNTLAFEPASPQYSQYDFTDISPSFFGTAQEIFEKHKRMEFRTLDIEKEPSTQGFENSCYDLVIAANVLHATNELKNTLSNVRAMLKPGGKLILAEITVPDAPRNGFLFGLLPGWWLSSEEYRQQSPCISEKKWDEVLNANGFSGTDAVFQDFKTQECHGWSIMVATAVGDHAKAYPTLPGPIIIADSSVTLTPFVEEIDRHLGETGNSIFQVMTLDAAAKLRNHSENQYILLNDVERPLLPTLQPTQLTALQSILASADSLLWVTRGGGASFSKPEYGSVQGLCRVSRREHFNVKLVTLALEEAPSSFNQQAKNIATVFMLTASRAEGIDLEPEYMEIAGLLHINRISPARTLNDHIFKRTVAPVQVSEFGAGPPIKMSVRTPGLIDSLEFIKDPAPDLPLQQWEIEVEVRAVGVNFKDVLTVLGRVDTDKLGCECSGIIRRLGEGCGDFRLGDRVAICGFDFYRSYARSNFQCAVKIPDSMSFAEAAAIPTAFGTAYYCLCEVARMQPGESILIHAASGGTGQAAIQLAIHLKAEIYATVGSKAKKQLLMDTYGLAGDHIFYSRDTSFADGIRRMTKGQGVDVVINSLSGEGLVASWECIAPYGRFLEIGRRDIDSHGSLPMHPFINNASFTGVDLAAIVEQRPALIQRMLHRIILLVTEGKLRPAVPLTMYSITDVEPALRTLQSGRSSGKIVLEIEKTANVPTSLKSEPSYAFDKNATYVISGGLGGIGRSIARWMASRGATNLLLLSRSGSEKHDKAKQLLTELKSKGVRVEAPICDIAEISSLTHVVRLCAESMPPIKGCFQASMVLRDSTFGTMSFSDWEESMRPKVQGSWNLHCTLPKEMDFFIILSSACGIFGNVGQSNYAAGNTYQDALAQYRVSHGEKATALDLGVILSDGFVAENTHILDHLLRLGIMFPISKPELFALFDFYCDPARTFASPQHGQLVTGLDLPSNILARGGEVPYALRQPLFRKMHQIDSFGPSSSSTTEQSYDYSDLFAAASSLEDAGLMVSEALKKKLSRVLGIPQDSIQLQDRVEAYGVDSLVAVELRNWLAKEMSADVAVFEILGGATLIGVGNTVAAKSSFRKMTWGERAQD